MRANTCAGLSQKSCYLSRAEPEGPFGGIVLCQDGKHALHRSQDGSVDHDRPLMPRLCLILQVESVGQLEVQLDSGALELAHESVVHCDVNLGTVERAVPFVHLHAVRTGLGFAGRLHSL